MLWGEAMGYVAIWSQQQAGAQHPYEINGEATAFLTSPIPPLERMLLDKTQIQTSLLRHHVEEAGEILIPDNAKPLWTAGWVLRLCWESTSYCSNQDVVQLPTLFLNLQHK